MKWKIKEKREESIVYQEVRDDAYVVITVPKDLIEFIKE